MSFYFFLLCFADIATSLDSSFKKDQEIIVLPLDLVKYDTHENLTQDVLKHFGKVKWEFESFLN